MKVTAVLVITLIAGFIFLQRMKTFDQRYNTDEIAQDTPTPTTIPCVPTFVDGGGPYYLPDAPFRSTLNPENHQGQVLKVSGKVLLNDCVTPAPETTIDIWHADETGEYVNDWYRGQIITDEQGNYSFETVIPKGYGEGTAYRPPHIHFKIFRAKREVITSQMFFPDVTGREGFDDAYIMKTEEKTEGEEKVVYASHNIILP